MRAFRLDATDHLLSVQNGHDDGIVHRTPQQVGEIPLVLPILLLYLIVGNNLILLDSDDRRDVVVHLGVVHRPPVVAVVPATLVGGVATPGPVFAGMAWQNQQGPLIVSVTARRVLAHVGPVAVLPAERSRVSVVSVVPVHALVDVLREGAVEVPRAEVLPVHAPLPLVGEPHFARGVGLVVDGLGSVGLVVDLSAFLEGAVELLGGLRDVSSMVLLDGTAGRCGI